MAWFCIKQHRRKQFNIPETIFTFIRRPETLGTNGKLVNLHHVEKIRWIISNLQFYLLSATKIFKQNYWIYSRVFTGEHVRPPSADYFCMGVCRTDPSSRRSACLAEHAGLAISEYKSVASLIFFYIWP